MAEDFVRARSFDYRANSNLVLEADRETRRRNDEPTGEVESLWGNMGSQRMGDRVGRSTPLELEEKKKRAQKRKAPAAPLEYVPGTKTSRVAYETILATTTRALGDVPQDVLRGAAEEVVYLLKTDGRAEIERILGALDDKDYTELVAAGRNVEDVAPGGEKLDEEMGVAVVFEESSEDEDVDEVKSEEDEEEGVEAEGGKLMTQHEQEDEVDDLVDAHEIDAHWLQRGLSKYYDAYVSAKLSADILEILREDTRTCENKLVMLLDYDKFDFIKLLLRNQSRVLYCTLLKQAQTDEERKKIEEETPEDILEALKMGTAETWAHDRAADLASRTRKEAIGLNKLNKDNDDDEESDIKVAAADAPSRLVDLDSLAFEEGGRVMTNKTCELPASAWRAQKKGYEEVHVPALKRNLDDAPPLKPIAALPEWAQPAFEGMTHLNVVQSVLYETAMTTSENMLLCAPTGAGKTNCAVLTMLSQFAANRKNDDDPAGVELDLDAFKIVYVAPMKALVQECVVNFGKRLAPYGVSVRELSGDQSLTYAQLQETQIIVTTPEKWDIVTRKGNNVSQLVRLVIIDEIHLLHDDRGPVLEAIVARTIRRVEATKDNVRLVGLSATLPNYGDVAALLRVDPDKGLFYFDNSFRPVPLQQQYVGVAEKKALKRFQAMNRICFDKVAAQAGKNQVLIFVHSRAETVKTATALRDLALEQDLVHRFIKDDSATREILNEESATAKHDSLKDLLPYGFAIHHAGLTRADRNLVEDLFADRHVQVLVSTATLAWGVNLPAHTVIIKGTQIYSPERGGWTELSPLDVVQMMGRAGRPQFDSEGEGIILTKHSELQYYLSLMNQQLPVESQLVRKLPDCLNAEIDMGTVNTVKQGADWLAYTYLYVRMLQNPERYGTVKNDDDPTMLQHRLDLVHSAAVVLDKHNLVKYDAKTGALRVTPLGRVAAHYYVSYDSMATYNEHLKPTMSDIELFRLFSFSGEFKHIHVRPEEKLELQKLATKVPIPIKESVDEPSAKINALLQAYVSNLKLQGFALVADMTFVKQSAARLCRALFEIALKRKWAAVALKALSLCNMVERRLWQSQSPLRQFKGVPETIVRKLEKKDIAWDRYYDLKPQDLAELVKLPKMGKTLHRLVHQIPRLELAAHVQPVSRGLLKVDVTITPDFQFDPKVHDNAQTFHLIVEDVDGETILHHEPFVLRHTYAEDDHLVQFAVPVSDPLPPQYFLKVVSDRWLHATATLPISFKHLILPRKYPPHTELLDLQPLPVSAVDATPRGHLNLAARLYADSFDHFNPVQTQTFAALYESDDNVLVCAPNGSGRHVCAEFAMLRAIFSSAAAVDDDDENLASSATCVYVSPKQAVVRRRLAEWTQTFGGRLGLEVAELTGDVAADLRALDRASVVVCTADKWDVLSRRWKHRKPVQNVTLFVADDLHCLGSPIEGPTLEVVVSRMRYVASQLDTPPRIVGLAASLADAKDVGDWLGASKPSATFFSFHSNVRPIPCELVLHAFDAAHFGSRLLAMGKVLLTVIQRHAPRGGAPTLVFVTSRKQCQLTAIDVMVLEEAAADDEAVAIEDAELLESLDDPALRRTLARGVAFTHAGLSPRDRDVVDKLYRQGRVRVLIAPADSCWSLTYEAYLVVVMGTERYDPREHRYVDYAVTDLLEMIGKAGRPGVDTEAKCAVFCHTPKKDALKRLLYDPLPIESHLDRSLHEHLNAEIVTRTVESKQDAVDYLTWTFFYRRLTQNPNYYDLQGATHSHVSDHLSELVETVIGDLSEARCVAVSDEVDVSPLNLGMIGAYYSITYTTVELFASSVASSSKIPALVEILANASEFGRLPARANEDKSLARLAAHLPHLKLPEDARHDAFTQPHVKALVLLHAHFARQPLSAELRDDQVTALLDAPRLVQAVVDVISSHGWLAPALHAMELSQLLVQGLWTTDHALLQIPHVTRDTLDRIKEANLTVDSVFDILALEDDVRERILDVPPRRMAEIADFCNDYPNIELGFEVVDTGAPAVAGEPLAVAVTLHREVDDDDDAQGDYGRVRAHRYPGPKKEAWWLVVAHVPTNALLSIKRLNVLVHASVQLDFVAPDTPGPTKFTLYFMCDSYVGCDQEYDFTVNLGGATMMSDD